MTAPDAHDDDHGPARPPPLEVVIVASAIPIPVAATEPVPVIITDPPSPSPEPDPRPATFTGRPEPLGPSPTIEQLRRERGELRSSNAGRFKIEEPALHVPPPLPPPPAPPDRVATVLALLICLNTAKLCLILWILLTVLQVREQYATADTTRATIVTSLATLQRQLDQDAQQQQTLINRVDDALVRLQAAPPR